MSDTSASPTPEDILNQEPERPTRGAVIRDVLLFQVKLWLDGLKDIVLSPLSIIAAVLDVLFRNHMKKSILHMVLGLGERYDKWLNLYSAAKKGATKRGGMLDPEAGDDEPSLDDLLRRAPEVAPAPLQNERVQSILRTAAPDGPAPTSTASSTEASSGDAASDPDLASELSDVELPGAEEEDADATPRRNPHQA